jgi:hypothetical protein
MVLHEGDVSVSRSVIDILLPLNAFLHGTGEEQCISTSAAGMHTGKGVRERAHEKMQKQRHLGSSNNGPHWRC